MAVNQATIESKNFTLFGSSVQSNTNPRGNRTDYLAIGTNIFDNEILIRLRYWDNDEANITSYFNKALQVKEFYFMGKIVTEADLDAAIESIDYELTTLDLDDLNDYD